MAELRINIDTQAAAASARDLQRILNDIKMAARELDNLSLGTLGSTISRVADSMRTMQSAVSSTAPTVASIVTAVSGLSQALEGGIRSQQAWVAQWQAFNGTGNYARDVLRAFAQEIIGVVNNARNASTEMQRFTGTINIGQTSGAWQTPLAQFQQALSNIATLAANTGGYLAQMGEEFLAFSISPKVAQQALEALRASMPPIVTVAQQTGEAFAKAGQQFLPFTASVQQAQKAVQDLNAAVAPQQQAMQGLVNVLAARQQQLVNQPVSVGGVGMNDVTRQMLEQQARVAEQDRLAVQDAIRRRSVAAAGPAAQQTFLAPGTMYGQPQMPAGPAFADPTSQGVTGIAISNQRVYQTLATSAQQATQAVTPLGQAMAQTKEKKDALDKNIEKMSSGGGSLWQMTFALRTLTSLLGALSFRALYEEAKNLAEALVDTGMQLERATALFGLMGNTTMSAAQEIEFATKTAQEFGLAILPAIAGLGKMQASAYGTAYAGETVNSAFRGMMAGLAAVAADSQTTTSAMSALSDMIGRVEISGRGIRQLSRDFPGLRERLVAPMGAQDVEHLMLILDRGNFTVSQFLKAMQEAFGGMLEEKGRENINTLSGAVTGFYNALLKLAQVMLEAGFKRDFTTGLQDLTAVLTSPGFIEGAKQFGHIFGVVVKDALEAVASTLAYVREHLALVGGVIAGLVSAGGMLTFAAMVLTLARAFQILGVSVIGAAGPIGIIAALVGVGAAYWIAHSKATADAQKATDDLAKSTTGLANANKDVNTSVPTEHMVRYAKDEKAINDEIEKLRLTTIGYRDELGLLESGIQKDSVAFTGLATALKFYNEQMAHGNVAFDQAALQRLKDYAVAAQAAAAGIAKIAENRNQLRTIREESGITQRLTTMAAGGASEGVLTIERTFQEQFRTMRAHFEDLIYNERDMSTRNKLVDQFKQQAEALREVSIQAQLYANRLKAIQDLTQGARNLALEKEITAILSSPLREGATRPVTESTPSALEVSRPPTINPASESINAFMYQLDRANIGAQRQQLNGPVEMTITGNVTVNGMGGRAGGGMAGPGGPTAYDAQIQAMSQKYDVEFATLKAIIRVESGFNPNAKGSSGEIGISQFMPETAKRFRIDPNDPNQSIEGTAKYLRYLIDYFKGDVARAIAAYRAGEGNIETRGIATEKDRWYVETVQKYARGYGGQASQMSNVPSPGRADLAPTLPDVGALPKTATQTETQDIRKGIQDIQQLQPASMGTGAEISEQGIGGKGMLGLLAIAAAYPDTIPKALEGAKWLFNSVADLGGRVREGLSGALSGMQIEGESSGSFLFKSKEQLFPPTPGLAPTQMSIEEGRQFEAVKARTLALLEQQAQQADAEQQATQKRFEAIRQNADQQLKNEARLGTLYVEQQGLQPTALSGAGFTPGRLTAARRPRTQLEMERDIAGLRAVSRFDENIQLRAPQYDISRYQFGLATSQQEQLFTAPRTAPAEPQFQRDLNVVLRQRREAELQARSGADEAAKQAAARFNTELEKQNMNLKIAQEYISTDAKYRDIDARAAQAQQKALENSVSPELLARTQSLIEEERQLAHAQVDMNGPIQQSIDSIGDFKDRSETLFIGALNGMGDALATFASTGKFDIKSFADAFIADLVRMAYQLFLMKPLLMAIQGQGTFGENVLTSLGGTPESAYGSELGGMTTSAETLSGLEESIAAIGGGASTGGYVTLRGIEHFQGGGMVGRGRDTVPAMLSPGEIILNQAQQRSVASSMQGGGITYVFNPTIHAQDAESVRKTLPQIQAEFYRATERMARRNNIRGNT